MVIANTMFDHGRTGAVTYRAPGRHDETGAWKEGEAHQLDYIMVNRSQKSGILDAWSDATRTIDSDHFPVVASVQCRFKKPAKTTTHRQVTGYSNKQTGLDKCGMNKFFGELITGENEADFDSWEDAYKKYIGTLTRNTVPKRQHWLSKETWEMIQQKADEEYWWTQEKKRCGIGRLSAELK